ncbi:electron transport complex subunit RsxD [[Haemophilus] felis]|nr:electron transport complex subunit RsxD [[Haemophilus] felis]
MFKMVSSPHTHSGKLTMRIMLWVIVAMLPAFAMQIYYFGFGVLIQSCLAVSFAVFLEGLVTLLRKKTLFFYLRDLSVVLTALILAMAIPPYAPYWIILIGIFCAVILGKQVYGGLGQNLFNPAMVGYVMLLISFPVQMTAWLPPLPLLQEPPTWNDAYQLIFTGFTTDGFTLHQLNHSIDSISQATPLDSAKVSLLKADTNVLKINYEMLLQSPLFQHSLPFGWWQVNLAFLLGGLILIFKKVIHWHIPVAMLVSFTVFASLTTLFLPMAQLNPLSQLFSGAMMFGAFFIATDPVTASITPKGKLLFGALIGLLIYVIRFYGSYPDGVAFSILLANIFVPLIDHYTRPVVTGYQMRGGR